MEKGQGRGAGGSVPASQPASPAKLIVGEGMPAVYMHVYRTGLACVMRQLGSEGGGNGGPNWTRCLCSHNPHPLLIPSAQHSLRMLVKFALCDSIRCLSRHSRPRMQLRDTARLSFLLC